MTSRRIVILVTALCAGIISVGTALAHNGVGAAFKGRAGHYIVYAYDGESLPDGRLDYKLVLLNARNKNPVYDVHASVTANRAGGPAVSGRITTFGNVIFYNLPNPYPHDWNIHVQVSGPLGAGDVRYRMHGSAAVPSEATPVVAESDSRVWPIWLGGAAAGVVVLGGLLLLRRTALRRRASSR